MSISENTVPIIPRGVRLHHDTVRENWVLLAPERTIKLDPVGHAILLEIDGNRSFGAIVARLADKYEAPAEQIGTDAKGFIQALINRRILAVTP